MAYRNNEQKGRQNYIWGPMGTAQSPQGMYREFSDVWNPYVMPNMIQTCYQNRSPQNPSMGIWQGYMADAYMRQIDLEKQEEMEREEQKDMEYWRQMYPEQVKKMNQYVMELCDREDYEDSFIYDEYPDPVSIQNMIQQVLERLGEEHMFQEEKINGKGNRNWLKDLASVLLFEELHRRRCHSKYCRRRWY